MKIKKGDNVKIITGSEIGKNGLVIRAIPKKDLVVIENINLKNKRIRPKKGGEKGQTISVANPIHISNVRLLDKKPAGISTQNVAGGKKVKK